MSEEKITNNTESEINNRFLVFSIGEEDYALQITYITEIVEVLPITSVPSIPYYLNGIINLRGTIIPVMDARRRFGYESKEYDSRTCIIVIDNEGVLVGLVVDAVQEVATISNEEISMPPNSEKENAYVKGIGKRKNEVQLIIDCDKLLDA